MASSREVPLSTEQSDRKFAECSGVEPTVRLELPGHTFRLWSSNPTDIATGAEGEVVLLLYGELYEPALLGQRASAWLVSQYLDRGLDMARHLNGSFVIVVADARKDTVAVLTDRFMTRRAFYSQYKGAHWVSNCLYTHPLKGVPLDPVGVGWILVNRSPFNGRTPFRGVSIMDRACVHVLNGNGFRATEYWENEYDHSYDGVDIRRLKSEFSELLIQAIRRRLTAHGKIFLALSGGYDATGILGILRYSLNVEDVECFSFTHTRKPLRGGDAYQARKLAGMTGYNHRILKGYTGDVLLWLQKNGAMGNGIASPARDQDLYFQLEPEFQRYAHSAIMFGDEAFGRPNQRLDTHRDVLNSLDMCEVECAPSLPELMDAETFAQIREGLLSDQEAAVRKYPDARNAHDLTDMLYIDQRLPYYLFTHKEYDAGDFAWLQNPLIDNDVLDFVKKLPTSLRLDKRLYRETVIEMFPQLFAIPRSIADERDPNYVREFCSHRPQLEEIVNSHRSALDEIIPPDRIVAFMRAGLAEPTTWTHEALVGIKSLVPKNIKSLIKSILPTRRSASAEEVSPQPPIPKHNPRVQVLRRALALRSFLNLTVDRHIAAR
jgi:hypothetical protein